MIPNIDLLGITIEACTALPAVPALACKVPVNLIPVKLVPANLVPVNLVPMGPAPVNPVPDYIISLKAVYLLTVK